jgi:3-oxoacyl-[acyl-carrier protein] reductase
VRRFEGKVALVTGGGRGLGAATVERFAAEGCSVLVTDIDEAPAREVANQVTAAGGRALAMGCDVTQPAEVDAAADLAETEFGRLDCLVTCAGIIRDDLIHVMQETDFDEVINTHLKGTWLCAKAAQRLLVPRRYGRMLFFSSISARGIRGQSNYSAAKSGIEGLARALSLELGRFGITVNAIAPGWIATRMSAMAAARRGVSMDAFAKEISTEIALGRMGEPFEIASVAAFLCSDDASYVSGQTVYAMGGP